ncbi:MAG: UbiA prenyltransferase family protein [bacterium]|nr:UbiA prenyltransferase family protein [bacterium]
MDKKKFFVLLRALRINQWIKNFVVFTAVIFSGKLFEIDLLSKSFYAFIVFCLLSSTSYVLNDIIDYPFDKKHPVKKNRPIASGQISIPEATFIVFVMTLISLMIALMFSIPLFLLSLVYILLHFFYSLYLKKFPVIDIFVISFSFMLRTYGGEVVTGFHIPVWLTLTIFFISLFMATVKRHAELVAHGSETRISLYRYNEHLLDFLTNAFATMSIIAYATYTYTEKPPQVTTLLSNVFLSMFPGFEARKWMMITIPFAVYGIARYAQLLYEKEEGERPEQLITTDVPLVLTIVSFGIIIISLFYIL